MIEWYKSKGYNIPTHARQLWAKNKDGIRVKNGIKHTVPEGTKIFINPKDLPPKSGLQMTFICETCGKEYTTTWGAYNSKKTKSCRSCVSSKVKTTGCHSYWVKKLITDNPYACCDISGETDKRFLVLHHLLSRSLGGLNKEDNYVILSCNYHMAFHVWNGGTNIDCYPEDYFLFKNLELNGNIGERKSSRQKTKVSLEKKEDWIILD